MPDHIELPPDKRLEAIKAEILQTASTGKPLVIQSLLEAHGCSEDDFRQFLPIIRRSVNGNIIEETNESGLKTIRCVLSATARFRRPN